jgi:endonuclease YncB( thermonuclease family)
MSRTLPRIALLVALTAVVAAPEALAARPTGGPCTPAAGSPHCHYWYGKVKFFADGDTIDVNIAGDHLGRRPIRLTGINAMELHRYSKYRNRRRGDCHGVAAANRLEQIIRKGHGRRVRLAAQHARSRSGHRLRRQVSVRIHGKWVDANRIIVSEGYALFLSNRQEWAWNRDYEQLAEEAAVRGIRLWNPHGCGPGAARHIAPYIKLKWDADGQDNHNVNGEWARIFNPSDTRLRLGGWYFRDSALRRFTFPSRARIRPHRHVVLRMGRGHNHHGVFHWGLHSPPFENPVRRVGRGDGGYLFDRRGNVRAWVMYPCLIAVPCTSAALTAARR